MFGELGALPVAMHWMWFQLCKPRHQAEGCPKAQPGMVCTAQHLLSKVGDDSLVFLGPDQETLTKNN